MKLQFSLMLLSATCACAREVIVDDPGVGNIVNEIVLVPNILGYPDNSDPPIQVQSQVPVSVLRYHDFIDLQVNQPLLKQDIYVIVKSNCTSQDSLKVSIQYNKYNRSNYSTWDTADYTDSITIDIIPNANVTLVDTGFLEPTSFVAYWNYTPFMCHLAGGNGLTPSPTGLNDTNAPSQSSPAPAPGGETASASKSGIVAATVMGAVATTIVLLRDGAGAAPLGRKAGRLVLTCFALLGVLVVTFKGRQQGGVSTTKQRILRATGETCTANVEILVDGCRRSFLENKTDLEVMAPELRILNFDLTDMAYNETPDDPCNMDYVAYLDFNATDTASTAIATGRATTQHMYMVPSLVEDFLAGIQCPRPIGGRPFVDVGGHQLQAPVCMEPSTSIAWSAEKVSMKSVLSSDDQSLGREWAERALGEHASVPAFAAFTIALMSNNAPPVLVQDALTAAMDEVRHAKTSFEIASLLLGTTVEPGPIPPSVHRFEQNLIGLAVAVAQEGCIDETLSALVAAFEVDTRLDRNDRIDEATKSLLKDKMRTIALEESSHSALAWRTVLWACKMDSDACSIVNHRVFGLENLEQAFEERFGRYGLDVDAQSAWEQVHRTLIPFVIGSDKRPDAMVNCTEAVGRQLREGGSLLEQMAVQIIHKTSCASLHP